MEVPAEESEAAEAAALDEEFDLAPEATDAEASVESETPEMEAPAEEPEAAR